MHNFQITKPSIFHSYYEELKDYYKNNAPSRCRDFLSFYFPRPQPNSPQIVNYFNNGWKAKILTKETETLRKENWSIIVQSVRALEKKFGLFQDEIHIAKSLTDKVIAFAISGNVIIVNEKRANAMPPEVQKFHIAHELVHYQRRHLEKRILLGMVWVVIDLACLTLTYLKSSPLFLLALVVTEIAAFHFDKALSYKQEKEADLMAINRIKSNEEAVKAFRYEAALLGIDYIERNPTLRDPSIPENERTFYWINLGLEVDDNNYLPHLRTYPSLRERIKYCHSAR